MERMVLNIETQVVWRESKPVSIEFALGIPRVLFCGNGDTVHLTAPAVRIAWQS